MKIGIIGGGIAGLCTALDLSLRGFEVEILERGSLGSGTTTKCAGMLHSGARYVNKEIDIAKFCSQENLVIKKILPYAVGSNEGLFIVRKEYDQTYVKNFEENLKAAGINFKKLTFEETKSLCNFVDKDVILSYLTPDVVINPHLIVQAYREELQRLGVSLNEEYKIERIYRDNSKWKVEGNDSRDYDILINATGSWANDVCKLVGFQINLTYIHGSMAILDEPLVDRVVTACAPNRSGDVILPSGSKMMIGSTWHELDHNIQIEMSNEDIRTCVDVASEMIPKIKEVKISGSFTGIRTHQKPDGNMTEEFAIKRNFSVIDHTDNGFDGFYTILAGKLSLGRLVAQNAADMISKKYGIDKESVTSEYIVPEPKEKETVKTLDVI